MTGAGPVLLVQMLAEPVRIDRGGGDDAPQFRALGQAVV